MLVCPNPRIAWVKGHAPDGKRILSFDQTELEIKLSLGLHPETFALPCGRCPACLKRRRDEMSLRILKETECYNGQIAFLTLTYDDNNLPFTDGCTISRGSRPDCIQTLDKRDIQLLLKRLRRHLEYHHGLKGLRFCVAGEYGKKGIRPHWHLLIFGWVPEDLTVWEHHAKYDIYRSATIEQLWPYGFSTVGFGNGAVGRYVAKYMLKDGVATDPRQVKECFWASNRKGGLGAPWWRKHGAEAAARGFIVQVDRQSLKSFKYSIPRYFKRLFAKNCPYCASVLAAFLAKKASEKSMDDEFWRDQRNKMSVYLSRVRSEVRTYEDTPAPALLPS